ncbi:hypothetical protein JNUCC76_06770 [Leuconostoc sp. JNUCC 76]
MINGKSKTLQDVKQLEKYLAILEEGNEMLKRAVIVPTKKFVM